MEDKTIISIYGEKVRSNYNLITIGDSIELLDLSPARIYDKLRNKTIYVEIGKGLASVLNKLILEGLANKVAVKVNGQKVYAGRYTKEYICEALEKGSVFSFAKLFSTPDITKLYSYEYKYQLWISTNNKELTLEELCGDLTVQAEGIRTQMIHLMFSKSENGILISHIDHEYIYYSLEEYEKRQKDPKMRTKGSAHKRVKTFMIDEASIPMDYPCKMLRLNETKNEYEEVNVPFLFFVADTFLFTRICLRNILLKLYRIIKLQLMPSPSPAARPYHQYSSHK